jgi:hypothetical protein
MPNFKIYVVLHGGLGNQLFQFFRALVIANENKDYQIFFIEDFLKIYNVPRQYELDPILEEMCLFKRNVKSSFLIKIRLPKLLAKFILAAEPILKIPGYGLILDGYFQSLSSYKEVSKESIDAAISLLRKNFIQKSLIVMSDKYEVCHVRLTDFFKDKVESRKYVSNFLLSINRDVDIVTDDEILFEDELLKMRLPYQVHVIPTQDFTAWDLVKLFSRYKKITSNGSSLAFWASMLSQSTLETTNKSHHKLWLFFNGIEV